MKALHRQLIAFIQADITLALGKPVHINNACCNKIGSI